MKKIYVFILTGLLFTQVYSQINTANVCSGSQACLVTGAYHGNIQWESSADMISWNDIPSAVTDTFCFTVNTNGYYRASITDGTCNTVYSDTTSLNIQTAGTGSSTFNFTGAYQQFIVPACIDSVTITCYGAQGGNVTGQSPFPEGGLGAIMSGRFAVSPGQVLTIVVGGRGSDDPSTAGGGGASGVALGAVPLIIAGGGAGCDFQDPYYGGIHATIGANGVNGNGGAGPMGGTAGSDGGDMTYGANNTGRGGRGWGAGNTGTFGLDGTSPNTTWTFGTFGLGGGGGSVGYGWCNCGGGGGGYSGGGSGDINNSGGGGSSYNIGYNQNNQAGVHTGNGSVVINY
jgi:hypothetical protein